MEPIELTKEHKSKLLEMCKTLFPEYSWNITAELLDLDDNNPNKFENTITYCEYGKDINRYSETIHWFEFCMTHLRMKLGLSHDDMFCTANPGMSFFIHPIDYLYKQFLMNNF